MQCFDDQFLCHLRTVFPAHDPAGEQIDQHGHVAKAAASTSRSQRDVRDVSNPDFVDVRWSFLAGQQVVVVAETMAALRCLRCETLGLNRL